MSRYVPEKSQSFLCIEVPFPLPYVETVYYHLLFLIRAVEKQQLIIALYSLVPDICYLKQDMKSIQYLIS